MAMARVRLSGLLLIIWISVLLCLSCTNAFQASSSPLFSSRPSMAASRAVILHASTTSVDKTFYVPKPAAHFNAQRYSASDWWHNIKSLPRSTVLREIKGPVSAVGLWSALVSIVHMLLVMSGKPSMLSHLTLSSKPHSLLVSSLGLLLVFRTNSAYQRFNEGRKIWEKILSVSRNTSRMATLYVDEVGTARLNRILRLLAAFPYLLRLHVQPGRENSNVLVVKDESESVNGQSTQQERQQVVDRQVLPWCLLPPTALQKCISSSNRPLWICDRLSEELQNVDYTDNYTSRERLAFLSQIGTLSKSVGECERIHQTAVPLNYARHSLRSLTFWLLTLPFCLVGDLHLLTAPVMGAIAWLMLGVYQIGYTIEDPFQGSLRLRALCDAIYRDVMTGSNGMLLNRQSAFEIDNDEVEEWSEKPPEPSLP